MPLVRIQAKADPYVAIGQQPDAVNGPRTLVRAGVEDEFYCEPGGRAKYALPYRFEIVTGARCAWNAMTLAAKNVVHARNAATVRMLAVIMTLLSFT